MGMSVNINPQTATISGSRSLRRSGSSMVLTMPPEMVQSLGWEPGADIEMVADWDSEEITLRKR